MPSSLLDIPIPEQTAYPIIDNSANSSYDINNIFSDVPTDHWAYDEIQFFYKAGVVAGMSEDTFAPDENVTREQFAKLLALIFSRTDYVATEQTFTDVTSDMWSYNYIEAVKQYLTGYYPTGAKPFFNPAAKASREDIAYSLVKITGLSEEGLKDENILNQFNDSNDVSPSLKKYIGIAVENGLIRGYDGKFRPQDGITRAETVVLLFRALKAPVNQSPIQTNVPIPSATPEPTPVTPTTKPLSEYQYSIETDDVLLVGGWRNGDNSVPSVYGHIALGWTLKTNEAYFLADLNALSGINPSGEALYFKHTTSLIKLESCTNDTITGYFETICDGEDMKTDSPLKIVINGNTLTIRRNSGFGEYDYLVANIKNFTPKDNNPTVPAPTPEPTPKAGVLKKVPTTIINSNTPIYFKTPDMTDFVTPDSGNARIHWREDGVAHLDATYQIGEDTYTFTCVSVFQVNEEGYHGMFEIKKNGEVIETVDGKIYALPNTIGVYPYFKFYSQQEQWHFSGQITRISNVTTDVLEYD